MLQNKDDASRASVLRLSRFATIYARNIGATVKIGIGECSLFYSRYLVFALLNLSLLNHSSLIYQVRRDPLP